MKRVLLPAMKTILPYLFAVCLLFPWCSAPLFAQQNQTAGQEKKITITKRSVDADGSEITETIIKKGSAAENFDVDKYVRENRSEQVQVEVRIEKVRLKADGKEQPTQWSTSSNWSGCTDNQAFLGVQPDSDEDEDKPGVVVQVIRQSAAALAGLKTNDVLLRINDQTINQWEELTAIINKAIPGDKLKITYLHNKQEATAEATLTKRRAIDNEDTDDRHGFLGVSENDDDEDEAGVQVSITSNSAAAKAGLVKGDKILQINGITVSDFEDISDIMDDTQPGEQISIAYARNGREMQTTATLGEEQGWNWPQWNSDDWDWGNMDFNVQQKEACLGVYTEENEEQPDLQGARITSFTSESAAKESQLLENDVITAINGLPIESHADLWNAVSKYKSGDQVKVDYLRNGQAQTVQAKLKPCQDDASQVTMAGINSDGNQQSRQFNTWNWNSDDQRQMRQNRLITIHKGGEGDAATINVPPAGNQPADRLLKLETFKAYPNPAQGQVTVEFRGAPVATIVSLLDLNGRQLFREELNMFGGEYDQQFDLSEYAKGTIIILVQQGDKSFTEQIVMN